MNIKPGSVNQQPLYGYTGCYEDYSWPACDLRVHDGECWCERRWELPDLTYWDDLEPYTPVEQQPEVLAKGYFHPLPDENDYEFYDAEEDFPNGTDCPTCVPAVIVRNSAVANQPVPDVSALVGALEKVIKAAPSRGPLWHGSEQIVEARAALAAHRKGGE